MSNTKEKQAPTYELVESNENVRFAVVRKIDSTDFKIDDLLNMITSAGEDIVKTGALAKYNASIMENIKGFHPEIVEYFNSLEGEKKTAFLLFAKAYSDKEKQDFQVKQFEKEMESYKKEIEEIEKVTGLKII